MDLSCVIASFADPLGLYLTTFAVIEQLSKTRLEWEIVIAADGGTDYKYEKLPNVRCLRLTGGNRTGSPQGTRDAGIRAASAASVLCIESHVVINDIASLLEVHKALGGAITVPARIGETAEMFSSFGYEMDWESGSFWNKRTIYSPQNGIQPWRIVGFGHAAFMIDRDWYIRSGGYCLEMKGFGGEEPDLNLLVWQTGRETWMVPSVTHAHYLTPGAHGDETISPNFARNFCIAAYEHGGHEYLQKVETHFGYRLQKNVAIEARRKLICGGKFGGDLNRLREHFRQEGIVS
jgi:hypothetical protein